jgi:hypothetical protein
VADPSLENWGPKPSGAILRNQMTFLGVKNFPAQFKPHDAILHIDTFPTVKTSHQSKLVQVDLSC